MPKWRSPNDWSSDVVPTTMTGNALTTVSIVGDKRLMPEAVQTSRSIDEACHIWWLSNRTIVLPICKDITTLWAGCNSLRPLRLAEATLTYMRSTPATNERKGIDFCMS